VSVPQIRQHWQREHFDAALVLGWHTRGHLQAIRAARRQGLPLILRGESTLEMRPAGRMRAALRAVLWLPVRRHLYRRALAGVSAVVATGTRNREYFQHFGVPADRTFVGLYCVENDHFRLDPERLAAARARIRQRIGAPEAAVVFLVSGKLVPGKRPLDALRAFAAIAPDHANAHLLFVGDGPSRPSLQSSIRALGLGERVSISGFINQSELPDWYAGADCLVQPSNSETWGLVVNEAMAAGLAVIASDAVGCVPDLVHPGQNGFVFPVSSTACLRDAMSHYCSLSAGARLSLGRRSQEIVAAATFERVVDAVVAALERVRPLPQRE
jgi:glycosyltransferase involved in cell wall biosynthesis